MKYLLVLACAIALTDTVYAADHGPVFSYATPVNSEREFSFDAGIVGRNGSQGTQFSTGSGLGYGITPHLTVNAFLPASFGSGSLPESRIVSGGEWSAGASWRFLHSGYERRKADRIHRFTRFGGSRPSTRFRSAGHLAPRTSRCRHARYRNGLSQSVRLGWRRLYPLRGSIAR
jgi:hypothetical protein